MPIKKYFIALTIDDDYSVEEDKEKLLIILEHEGCYNVQIQKVEDNELS